MHPRITLSLCRAKYPVYNLEPLILTLFSQMLCDALSQERGLKCMSKISRSCILNSETKFTIRAYIDDYRNRTEVLLKYPILFLYKESRSIMLQLFVLLLYSELASEEFYATLDPFTNIRNSSAAKFQSALVAQPYRKVHG